MWIEFPVLLDFLFSSVLYFTALKWTLLVLIEFSMDWLPEILCDIKYGYQGIYWLIVFNFYHHWFHHWFSENSFVFLLIFISWSFNSLSFNSVRSFCNFKIIFFTFRIMFFCVLSNILWKKIYKEKSFWKKYIMFPWKKCLKIVSLK